MTMAIALDAASMNDVALLVFHASVMGAEASGITVRRTLELTCSATLDKVDPMRACPGPRARLAADRGDSRRVPASWRCLGSCRQAIDLGHRHPWCPLCR
jgi:hypothetical protein